MQTTSTHAALVVQDSGQMRIESVPTRRPRAGEILVSSLSAGICGSDLDMLRGARPVGTHILGHEGVAKVVEVGPGVSTFSAGQYVIFWPNNPDNPDDTLGVNTEGLYQQYLLVAQPALERGMVIPCEPDLPLICAPLSEPFATAIYGQRLVEQVCKPENAIIIGAGPIGLFSALYARERGCSRIFLIDRSQARLDWAVKRGIVESSHALLNSPQLVDVLLERNAGQGFDAVYLCTPRSATRSVLTQALRLVREEGCIELASGTDSREAFPELPGVDLNGIRQANVCGLGREVKRVVTSEGKAVWLTGHSGASKGYLQEAMQILTREPARYAGVISHIVSYRAAPRMFEHLLAANPENKNIQGAPCAKVIIDFTREEQEIEVFDPH